MMRLHLPWLLSLAIGALLLPGPARAQSAPPDFNGLWQPQYTPDLTRAYGKDLPFTPHGAERWKNVDTAKDPTAFCLPVGPARALQSPYPFEILQTKDRVSMVFEYQWTFRLIYTDGRTPPADIADYPEWMGYSTGRWEGDTLAVDTVAIHERSWLDTAGHEHSDKLRLTERFKKVNADTIEWTVTFDDPVFFTQPWSITRSLRRLKSTDRIMSYSCEENNKDIPHLIPTK
jgi:hypothetical protein